MNELLDKLKSCPLFRNFPENVLENQILPHGNPMDIPKNATVIQYQEKVDCFSVVISGRIHTLHSFEDGSYSICHVLHPGGVIGVDLLWTGSRVAPYFAVAAEVSRILRFPASLLEARGGLDEKWRMQILEQVLALISLDNMRKEYRLTILSRKGLRERILTYLTMQGAKRRTATFTIPFTREELASFLCVNRSAMCHELSMMQQEGLISFRKNEFTICNWESTWFPDEKVVSI